MTIRRIPNGLRTHPEWEKETREDFEYDHLIIVERHSLLGFRGVSAVGGFSGRIIRSTTN